MNPIALLSWFEPKNIKFLAIGLLVLGALYVVYDWQAGKAALADTQERLTSQVEQTEVANGTIDTMAAYIDENQAEAEQRIKEEHAQRLAQQQREDKFNEAQYTITDPYTRADYVRRLCQATYTISSRQDGDDCGNMQATTIAHLEANQAYVLFTEHEFEKIIINYERLADYFRALVKD